MRSPRTFRRVEHRVLKHISTGNARHPTLYSHPNIILREGFWWRLREIDRQMSRLGIQGGRCLDIGGGEGVLLPTLAARFDHVTCVDLDTVGAEKIVRLLPLHRADLIEAQFEACNFNAPFDAIVAADVLEHYPDLGVPVAAIRRCLRVGGFLFTSLPTESAFYIALRRVFGVTKPEDHYHTAAQVERFLAAKGFVPVLRRKLPMPILSVFTLTAWTMRGQ